MADIELVIKLDEEYIKQIDRIRFLIGGREYRSLQINVINAIKNGTPLPKGHGRLIDADALDVTTVTTDDYSGNEVLDVVLKDDIDNAPTIIGAGRWE